MRISDWSSDVCSSDLAREALDRRDPGGRLWRGHGPDGRHGLEISDRARRAISAGDRNADRNRRRNCLPGGCLCPQLTVSARLPGDRAFWRSEEHTSELQSLMCISYAVCCLKKQTKQ